MATLTNEGYLTELLDIKEKLEDFVILISQGRATYFKDVALKLRILYCKKRPLLKEIELRFLVQCMVAIKYSIEEQVARGMLPASLLDGLHFQVKCNASTWFERGHELVPIWIALERDAVILTNESYSLRRIIEVMADRMGGAHIDQSVPDADLKLYNSQTQIGGFSLAESVLFDVARSSIKLIELIEDKLIGGNASRFIIASL